MLNSLWNKDHWLFDVANDIVPNIKKAIILSIIINIFQVLSALFVMTVYNKIIPNSALSSLLSLAVGILLIGIFEFALRWVKSRLMDDTERQIEQRLGPRLFSKVLSWDLDSRPQFAGSSAMLVRDVESISDFVSNQSITTIVSLFFIFVYVTVIYMVAANIAALTAIIVTINIITSIYFYKKLAAFSDQNKINTTEKNSIFIEAVSNLETLKSIASYDFFQGKWDESERSSRITSSALRLTLSDMQSISGLLQSIGQVLVVGFGAYWVINREIDGGALFAAIMLNSRAAQPVAQISGVLQKYSLAQYGFRRLDSLFTSVSEEEKRRKNIRLNVVNPPIVIRDLRYSPQKLQYDILNIKRLTLRERERIGIVGSVGSGKSTFLKLLAGVSTPTAGSISYSSFDTTAIHQNDLRSSIAYLSQSPAIFAGSVRDNIVLGQAESDLQDTRLKAVIEMTGLEVVLRGLPNGLSFQLSEGGRELSGGQRQILALARVMFADPSVILLDEPTSAMDPKHERLFINRIKAFVEGKTLVVVTHRRPILELTDRILVMEAGKLAMDGSRDEILKKFG